MWTNFSQTQIGLCASKYCNWEECIPDEPLGKCIHSFEKLRVFIEKPVEAHTDPAITRFRDFYSGTELVVTSYTKLERSEGPINRFDSHGASTLCDQSPGDVVTLT